MSSSMCAARMVQVDACMNLVCAWVEVVVTSLFAPWSRCGLWGVRLAAAQQAWSHWSNLVGVN